MQVGSYRNEVIFPPTPTKETIHLLLYSDFNLQDNLDLFLKNQNYYLKTKKEPKDTIFNLHFNSLNSRNEIKKKGIDNYSLYGSKKSNQV